MKILILNHEFPPVGGGGANASFYFARELVKLNCRVTVVTAAFENLPLFEKREGIEINRIACLRKKIIISNPIEHISYVVKSTAWILKNYPDLKPDIAVAFHGIPAGLVAWVLKKKKHLPYITLLRGGDVPGWWPEKLRTLHFFSKPFIRGVWNASSALAANSEGLRSLALKSKPRQEIGIIYNGVDTDYFKPAFMENPSKTKFIVLTCGRLTTQKRIDLLIRSFQGLSKNNEGIELRIAGAGPEHDRLKKLCLDLGLAQRTHFLGWIDKSSLLKEYQTANVFVLMSSHEGMSNVILEAMACGRPVIASRAEGNKELVRNNENGFLISEDEEEIAKAINHFILNPALLKKMGERSRAIAMESFTWKTNAEKLLKTAKTIVE